MNILLSISFLPSCILHSRPILCGRHQYNQIQRFFLFWNQNQMDNVFGPQLICEKPIVSEQFPTVDKRFYHCFLRGTSKRRNRFICRKSVIDGVWNNNKNGHRGHNFTVSSTGTTKPTPPKLFHLSAVELAMLPFATEVYWWMTHGIILLAVQLNYNNCAMIQQISHGWSYYPGILINFYKEFESILRYNSRSTEWLSLSGHKNC